MNLSSNGQKQLRCLVELILTLEWGVEPYSLIFNKIRYSCPLSRLWTYSLCFICTRVIDDTFRLSKCVQIARLYLEVLTAWCYCILMLKKIHLVHVNMKESCDGAECRPVVNGWRHFILKRIVLQTGVCVSDQQSLHVLFMYFSFMDIYSTFGFNQFEDQRFI